MLHTQLRRLTGLLMVTLMAATPVKGAIIYIDEATFVSKLDPGYYFQDFESFGHGDQGTNTIALSGGTPTFNLNMSSTGDLYVNDGKVMSTVRTGDTITIRFPSNNVTAVGAEFFLTSGVEVIAPGAMNVTLSDGTVVSFSSPASGAPPFYGFTTNATNPITSLSIISDAGLYNSFDNLYVGTPEPATWGWTGGAAALTAAGVMRRRKRTAGV
jgi:hypothetical protein